MSDSLQTFLSQIGDVTLEKFTDNKDTGDGDPLEGSNQMAKEVSPGKPEGHESEKQEAMDSAEDMDLEETIDSEIGVRVIDQHNEPENKNQNQEDKKVEEMDAVNILESLPLAGKNLNFFCHK